MLVDMQTNGVVWAEFRAAAGLRAGPGGGRPLSVRRRLPAARVLRHFPVGGLPWRVYRPPVCVISFSLGFGGASTGFIARLLREDGGKTR